MKDLIIKHETSNARIKLKNESTNNIVWKMPTNLGTANQVLKIDSVVRDNNIDSTSLTNVNQLIWDDAEGSITVSDAGDNRVLTSGGGSDINGEENLTFNGSTLSTTGDISK